MSQPEKVLVLCAAGKVGSNVCIALKEAGFEVYGTTRSSGCCLESKGIHPVIRNCTVREDLDCAFVESGAKKVVVITDYFKAAKCKAAVEIQQGKDAIDAAKAACVSHLIYVSVADADLDHNVQHFRTKLAVEECLKSSGLRFSVLRPTVFFENIDTSSVLREGRIRYAITTRVTFCSTYDIGRAAAIMFKNPHRWLGKKLDVVSWAGELGEVAAALEKVRGEEFRAFMWIMCKLGGPY